MLVYTPSKLKVTKRTSLVGDSEKRQVCQSNVEQRVLFTSVTLAGSCLNLIPVPASYPDVSLARAKEGGKETAVCTLPMVPCGSSPVVRLYLAKNEAPEEEAVPVQFYILLDIFLLFRLQAIIHVQQLKDDLQKERDRHDQYMKSTSEKMEKERENVRQACLVEANKLSKQVN